MFPLLGSSDPLVSDAFTAELIHADTGFNIGKLSAGWQGDKQHAAFERKRETVCFTGGSFTRRLHNCVIQSPPEFYDIGVGISPGTDKG